MHKPPPDPPATRAPQIGVCAAPYCGRPAVAYVSRTVATRGGGRFTAIVGARGELLGSTGSVDMPGFTQLRCLDCLHDELDALLAHAGDAVTGLTRDKLDAQSDGL